MTDIARKYTKQLTKGGDKSLVLMRMVVECCRVALQPQLVRRLVKIYGSWTVYNAILSTTDWAHRRKRKPQDVFRYLSAVCRNMAQETEEIAKQIEATTEQMKLSKSVIDEVREIHDRKATT